MLATTRTLATLALTAILVSHPAMAAEPLVRLVVHKSPTCGCCGKWIDHLEANGFAVTPINAADLSKVKRDYNIRPAYRSCHPAGDDQTG